MLNESDPFYPAKTEEANVIIKLYLQLGTKFIYRNIAMIVIKSYIAQKFLASPWGISPTNEDCYIIGEYKDGDILKNKIFDKHEILAMAKELKL